MVREEGKILTKEGCSGGTFKGIKAHGGMKGGHEEGWKMSRQDVFTWAGLGMNPMMARRAVRIDQEGWVRREV